MPCPKCHSTDVKERPERTAQGYRRFRCLDCAKQFNERSGGLLNRARYPSDVIALVVLWRLRYKLSLRDLAEMFLIRGIVFSYEAVSTGRQSYANAGRDPSSSPARRLSVEIDARTAPDLHHGDYAGHGRSVQCRSLPLR